ncbi:hypothetical protein D3C76_1276950 [compost metagenome]
MNAQGFFAPAIGLARYIDNGDQRTLVDCIAVGVDGVIHCLGQTPALQQTDFALASTGKATAGIGHHRQQTHGLLAQPDVSDFQRSRQAFQRSGVATQGFEPAQASQ